MKIRTLGLVGLLLIGCNKPTNDTAAKDDIETDDKQSMNHLIGVWTDGSGPNASFAIEGDSIRDVEHFTASKLYTQGDTLTVYYPDDSLRAIMYKVHADTLVYEYSGHKTKYWRFSN